MNPSAGAASQPLPSAAEPREMPEASCGPRMVKHEVANLAALSWGDNAGSAKHRGDFPPGCAP